MWTKIDDSYFDNEKVLKISGQARFLHLASMIWAAGHSKGTGVLPKPVLATLGAHTQLATKDLDAAARLLVRAGLWEDEGDDWILHDFIPYTPPKEREKNAQRLAAWRAAKRQRNGSETPIETALHGAANAARNGNATGTPVPVPVVPSVLPDPAPDKDEGSSELRSSERARRT